MSLAASDMEELSGSYCDPAPLSSTELRETKPGVDPELFRVLTKAVEGLEWSSPEEPTRGCLDEWFLPECRQAPRQGTSPFFPEVN